MRIIYAFLLAAALSGCSHKRTARVNDVTKPEGIILKASGSQNAAKIYGIKLRFHGHLDGSATIGGLNVVTQNLAGDFDLKTGGDWYSSTCQLQYSPTNAHSGNVEIEYEFLDM